MIVIPRQICRDLKQAATREWLVTNGTGSYASATITGLRTRRYHGLLVAALQPPLGRTVLLANLDEEVEVDGHTYRLGTDEFPNGVVSPDGFLFLQDAVIDGMIPTLHFSAANFDLRKTIWMEYGCDTTYVRYDLDADSEPVHLTLLPFCTYRGHHGETRGSPDWNFGIQPLDSGFRVTAQEGARPYSVLGVPGARFTPLGLWYWNFQQRAEAERGLDSSEDLYLPGLLRARLEPGHALTIIVTLEAGNAADLDVDASLARARARQLEVAQRAQDDLERQLFLAADQFLVARPRLPGLSPAAEPSEPQKPATVMAGYHWFGDWGRDTMISLEGLALTPRRFDVARRILLAYAQFVSEGMLPNRFPDDGTAPEYNTVDATLWYFHAVDRYIAVSGDRSLLPDLFAVLREVVDWHVRGTRYHIHVDRDGLLYAGEPGVQLTWMDAKVGDWVVTPRIGKPVEVNALWYNALRLMQEWAKELGAADSPFEQLADRAESSFARFWFAPGGYLYDVIDGPGGDDSALRPNQLFALSLPHSAVPPSHARSILEIVTRELLTPYGLRTLTPRNPDYRGRYTGDLKARDAAYHNGTVWPWLIGAYVDALCRVAAPEEPRPGLLDAFQDTLEQAGLGTLSECYEGDPPHRPVGTIAQAWSVAEVLRARRVLAGQDGPRFANARR